MCHLIPLRLPRSRILKAHLHSRREVLRADYNANFLSKNLNQFKIKANNISSQKSRRRKQISSSQVILVVAKKASSNILCYTYWHLSPFPYRVYSRVQGGQRKKNSEIEIEKPWGRIMNYIDKRL